MFYKIWTSLLKPTSLSCWWGMSFLSAGPVILKTIADKNSWVSHCQSESISVLWVVNIIILFSSQMYLTLISLWKTNQICHLLWYALFQSCVFFTKGQLSLKFDKILLFMVVFRFCWSRNSVGSQETSVSNPLRLGCHRWKHNIKYLHWFNL